MNNHKDLDLIPTEKEVRERLSETVRHAALLRRLLPIAIKADEDRAILRERRKMKLESNDFKG